MDEFNLFVKLAKPLVLNLPNAKDRAIAAQWLNKLREVNAQQSDPNSDDISVEYLKLLLYAVQSNQLTGIFGKPPPDGGLHDILQPGQRTAMEMISLVKRPKTSTAGSQSIRNHYPRVVTSIGGDMCEYVAVQEIPNFGIHGYYALSTEPLPKWWNPRNSANPETEVSSHSSEYDSGRDSEAENFEEAREETHSDNTIIINRAEAEPSNREFSKKRGEKMKHGEKSLQKIFQAQRSEIAGVETRPRWGRSRYIDRLIDESPHHVGDLDVSEADALLHLYRDKKLMKVKKDQRNGAKDSACAISSRRRQVEAKLDMPPCASVPVEEDLMKKSAETESRTCLPREIESDCMDEVMRGNYNRCCLSENEEYYPTDPIESAGSISLRGGSDDTGVVSHSGCCDGRRDRRQASRRNPPSRNRSALNDNTAFQSQVETLDGMDVDREIAEATALASSNISLDTANAGNFAWVKKDMHRFLNDHRNMNSTDFEDNTRRRDHSERYYNETASSRPRGCRRRTQQDYRLPENRRTSESATEPSHAVSEKTIYRSKAPNSRKPGVDEKARYWKEIVELEDRYENTSYENERPLQTLLDGYDTSCCGCRDQQYESEFLVDTEEPDFAYESEGEMDEDPMMVEEQRSRNPRAMISPNECNAVRDEMQRLIADPGRRAPPSRGRVKVPQKKSPRIVGEIHIDDENWDPPSHSTKLNH